MLNIIDLLGVLGLLSLLICYLTMLVGKLDPNSYKFLFGNLFGAISLSINGFGSFLNPPSILLIYPILNVVWIIGTSYQIIRKKWYNKR